MILSHLERAQLTAIIFANDHIDQDSDRGVDSATSSKIAEVAILDDIDTLLLELREEEEDFES